MTVVAGVDSSTQSTTVILRDSDSGVVVGRGSAPHTPTFPPLSEQDPNEWWQAMAAAFAQARSTSGISAEDISAVSIAAQCHGLVPLDSAGAVIRPAKLWNDNTSAPELAALVAKVGAEQWIDLVGSLPPASFTISKLAWLRLHEPANFDLLSTVLLPHDYLTWRLTGLTVTDRSDASGTGYYSAPQATYLPQILELVDASMDWASALPKVLGPSEPAGIVLPAVAREIGISTAAIVGPGAGDQHASALGLGAQRGDVVYAFGTSGVVFSTHPEPIFDHSGIVNSVADAAGGYLPLVCTLNAAKVTDLIARLLGVDHATLETLALAAPLRDDRPVFAPYIDGERTPNRPNARGSIAGISSETSREELALAAVEGVVLGLERGHAAIIDAGVVDSGRILVTGGASASAAYRQILADVTGREVEAFPQSDATAAGAAVQAASVLRGVDVTVIRDAWAPASVVAASPRASSYDSVRSHYLALANFTGLDGWPTDSRQPHAQPHTERST